MSIKETGSPRNDNSGNEERRGQTGLVIDGVIYREDGSRVIRTVTDLSMFDGNPNIVKTRTRTLSTVQEEYKE